MGAGSLYAGVKENSESLRESADLSTWFARALLDMDPCAKEGKQGLAQFIEDGVA